MPPDAKAWTPVGGDDAAEKFDIFMSSSGSAAQRGTGMRAPPSLENERRGQARATATRACSDRPKLRL
eukprot:1947922-Pyramimonas_sp.AAC.1